MAPKQIWITVGAVVAALVLGVAITLAVTGGDGTDEISTTGTRPTEPTTVTTVQPATTPPPTAAPTTPPTSPATLPPTTPPTVVVVPPPTQAPTAPPTLAPTTPPTQAPTAPPTPAPTVPPTKPVPPSDPGITATEIRVAVIADSPDSVAGVQAWAALVNAKKAGLAGRKIVVDPYLVNGSASSYEAAVKAACEKNFAIVGSLSRADGAVDDLQACGIPDLPARALSPAHRQAANTYAVVPTAPTRQQVGGFRWLLANVPGCCKQYVVSSTNPAAAAETEASVQAANQVGFTSAGGTALADDAPQSAYTAVVDEMESKGATFGRSDLPFDSTVKLRTEAQAQGFTAVKAWFCLAQCYQPGFLSRGGAAVDGQFVQIATTPFEDGIPAAKKYLANGGPPNQVGLESYAAALLFDAAARQVVAAEGKNGLTRAALLEVVAGIDDFTAGGILGLTNVGGRVPNGCFVMMKVANGKFVRAEPTGKGQLNCSDQNLLTVGP